MAGNATLSDPLPVTIDQAAPLPPTTPDLAPESDTGTSDSDNHTKDNTPTFIGEAEDGATVNLYVEGVLVSSGRADSTWAITTPSLADGTRKIHAMATDVAGNTSVVHGSPLVTIVTSTDQGYSPIGEDGSVYVFGTAQHLGDMRGHQVNSPIISVAYTPGGSGYWLVAGDGGVFSFGDAQFYGSMRGTTLNSPVIGIAETPSGKGYWLFAADGGTFSFGDAAFFGSTGGQTLNQRVFDLAPTETDGGYWLVARDGGIFSFGDAATRFYGSGLQASPPPQRVIGIGMTPSALGYWIADETGAVYAFGDATFLGDRRAVTDAAPMVAFATVPPLE